VVVTDNTLGYELKKIDIRKEKEQRDIFKEYYEKNDRPSPL